MWKWCHLNYSYYVVTMVEAAFIMNVVNVDDKRKGNFTRLTDSYLSSIWTLFCYVS